MKRLALLFALCCPLHAATYYVSKSGNDSNSGLTIETALLTMTHAATHATSPGDTVIVSAGYYPERVTLNVSGTAANKIMWTGPPTAQGLMRQATNFGFQTVCDHIDIRYFACSNNTVAASYNPYTTGAGIHVRGHDVTILSNDLMHGACSGLYVSGEAPSYDVHVIGNRCWSNSNNAMYICGGRNEGNTTTILYNEMWGITMTNAQNNFDKDADLLNIFGRYMLIASNYLHDMYYERIGDWPAANYFHMDAIQTWVDTFGGYGVEDTIYDGNIIWTWENINTWEHVRGRNNIYINNLTFGHRAGSFVDCNPKLHNNTFVTVPNPRLLDYDYPSYGAIVSGAQCTEEVEGWGECRNNVFVNSQTVSSYPVSYTSGANPFSTNNLVYQVGTTLPAGTFPDVNWFRNVDPRLYNPFASSFSLPNFFQASDGGGINVGDPATLATKDILSHNRPINAGFDLGFYEYGASFPSFTGTPTSGGIPLTVVFTNATINPYTNAVWDFGDTGTSNTLALLVSHTYSDAGSYTVKLTTTANGVEDVFTRTAYITATTPAVPFPTVATSNATSVADNSATLNGNLSSMGGASNVIVGFQWGATISYGSTTNVATNESIGTFARTIGGLTAGSTYHYSAFAIGQTNDVPYGTNYGSDVEFITTTSTLTNPAVNTLAATVVGETTATLNGNVSATNSATSYNFGFVWGAATTYANTNVFADAYTATNAYNTNLTGLTAGTLYNYKAFAIGKTNGVAFGTNYGSAVAFTTTGGAATSTNVAIRADGPMRIGGKIGIR